MTFRALAGMIAINPEQPTPHAVLAAELELPTIRAGR
jgi:hypothetical protein